MENKLNITEKENAVVTILNGTAGLFSSKSIEVKANQ
jgi:hypothetical protein